VVLTAIAYLALLAGGDKAPPLETRNRLVDQIGVVLRDKAFVPGVDFSNWKSVVGEYQNDISAAKTVDDFIEAVNSALFKYGVSHLMFTPPNVGIGKPVMSFGFNVELFNGHYVVTSLYAGTQEEKAGLRRGMTLEDCPSPETWERSRKIAVKFYDDAHTLRKVEFQKEKFLLAIKPVLVPLENDANTLEVEDLLGYDKKAVDGFMATAAKRPYLLIDLRHDLGGSPDCGSHLLGYFTDGGTHYGAAITKEDYTAYAKSEPKTASDRADIVRQIKAPFAMESTPAPARYKGHIAVLIDQQSGSCAEMVAQALREYAGAKIFGSRSCGLVLFMNAEDLEGGYQIYFPWRDYWSGKGYRIEGHPVVPDFPSDAESEVGPDLVPLRLRALKYLRETYPNP